jgi:hypothetical protein
VRVEDEAPAPRAQPRERFAVRGGRASGLRRGDEPDAPRSVGSEETRESFDVEGAHVVEVVDHEVDRAGIGAEVVAHRRDLVRVHRPPESWEAAQRAARTDDRDAASGAHEPGRHDREGMGATRAGRSDDEGAVARVEAHRRGVVAAQPDGDTDRGAGTGDRSVLRQGAQRDVRRDGHESQRLGCWRHTGPEREVPARRPARQGDLALDGAVRPDVHGPPGRPTSAREGGGDPGDDVGDRVGLGEDQPSPERRRMGHGPGRGACAGDDRHASGVPAAQQLEEPLGTGTAGDRRERVERGLEVVDDQELSGAVGGMVGEVGDEGGESARIVDPDDRAEAALRSRRQIAGLERTRLEADEVYVQGEVESSSRERPPGRLGVARRGRRRARGGWPGPGRVGAGVGARLDGESLELGRLQARAQLSVDGRVCPTCAVRRWSPPIDRAPPPVGAPPERSGTCCPPARLRDEARR